MDQAALPADLVLVTREVPDDSMVADLFSAPSSLPGEWRDYPAPVSLRVFGDRCVKAGETLLMRVPSVIVPQEYKFLLKPSHADWLRTRVHEELAAFTFDQRLLP